MIRAFQWDLGRQVERLDVLRRLLPRYAAWGYQELYLHLEDAVHYPSLPGIGRADAYRHEELGSLVRAATKAGIRVVPIANLLGHTQYLIKHRARRDLNERRDGRDRPLETGQVCPLHPRMKMVAARLLRDLAPFCTAGKVHVGLDESFHLGQCPRCRGEVARIGLGAHFAGHVGRLHALASGLGLEMGMWADMLYFTPDAIPLLPAGITAYDWYYYPFGRLPRVEFFNFAERDLATPLRAQGIRYYGCPMNGAFRHEPLPVFGDRLGNARSWWRRCQEVKADGFLLTSWESYRLALEATTAVDAAVASLWLEPATDDTTGMLAHGLRRVFGSKTASDLARRLIAADEHAFAGYARWQINDRWDVFAGTEHLKSYRTEAAFFRKLARRKFPPALAASLAFRRYLAERDLFVRQEAGAVFQLRRLRSRRAAVAAGLNAMATSATAFARELARGRRAALAMWARTRDVGTRGQNEEMVSRDETRLKGWMDWLRQAKRDPSLIDAATPLCGRWQLVFWVHNCAPAVQKIVVEQQDDRGGWQELASRFTIEFRAHAARPRTRLRREFSVPLDTATGRLRIAIRGVGLVEISHLSRTHAIEAVIAKRRTVWRR